MDGRWETLFHAEVLERSVHSPRTAREVLTALCRRGRVSGPSLQTALLLISEVVTNAVTHGAGRPLLTIEIGPDRLRVSVADSGAQEPRLISDPAPTSEHGRGVLLVDRLASRWGVEVGRASQKSVWFELDRA